MRIHDRRYHKLQILLPLFLLPLILPGCSLAAMLTPEGEAGAISLSISTAGSKTLLPAIDMVPAGYDISGTGPGGHTFSTATALTSVVIPGLAFGQWTVTVNAKNQAGTIIAQGSAAIAVQTGVQSSLTVIPTPMLGIGKISLDVTWVAADIQTASIDAQLTPGSGSPIALSFILAAGTATCQNASVPTGYYTLSIRLLDSGLLVMGGVEVVRIVKDQTTAGTFDFTQANKPRGAIAVSFTPLMSEVLAVTMRGQATGSNTNPSYTFGSSLPAGVYRLDMTAFTADGMRAGAASTISHAL